jgi:hypothetical protein
MASVLRPQRVQRRPSGDVSINWSHPLAHGLIACVLGGLPRNLVTRQAVTLATGSAGVISQEGLILNGSTGRYETNSLRQASTRLSMFGVVTPQGSGGRMALCYGNEGSGNSAIRLKSNGSNVWGMHAWSNDHDSSEPVVSGQRVTIGLSVPASGNFTMYVGGRLVLSNTTFAYQGTTYVLSIGAGPDSALEAWNGTIELACAWDRALSQTEQQWLAMEPYALLEAPRRWLVNKASAGGGGGRTTRNPRSHPLGVELGVGRVRR